MYYCYFESPVGKLLLTGRDKLEGLHFPESTTRINPEKEWILDESKFLKATDQLEAYFNGRLTEFKLDLDLRGTDFQRRTWEELRKIPYGETISYGQLARRIGNPGASRAVGAANGRNPVSIIVPCHRVIGKNGSLTGFGGGIAVKQFLLELEKKHL